MKPVPTLFVRDPQTGRVTEEVTPGCEWVTRGEGRVLRRFDGLWALVQDGVLYKRVDLDAFAAPADFHPKGDADPVTGKIPGWLPITNDDAWYRFAMAGSKKENGLYFLCGPKVVRNYDGFKFHTLVKFWEEPLKDVPLTYWGIYAYLMGHPHLYGILWIYHEWAHGTDRTAQVTRKDFGIPMNRVARKALA